MPLGDIFYVFSMLTWKSLAFVHYGAFKSAIIIIASGIIIQSKIILKKQWPFREIKNELPLFFSFFKNFLEDISPFLGPLIPLFWTSSLPLLQ